MSCCLGKGWLVRCASCASLLLACAVAEAADTADDDSGAEQSARADALFHQARALLDAGHIESACAKFEASQALENGLGTLLHLGDCYERAGRTASAWHTFLEAQAVAHSKKDADREQIAAERVRALEPKLTRVVFVVPSTNRVPGLTVTLGDNAIPKASWGTIIPVDAGVHKVRASAKGYQAWTMDLDVSRSEGRQYRVDVPSLRPAPAPASNPGNAYRTAGVITGSVGLAGIGAGAVFSALSHSADDATCAKGPQASCASTKPSNRTDLAHAATVSFALGGALFATGVTLFVLAPSPDHEQQHALRVAARVATNGGRLQLEGMW